MAIPRSTTNVPRAGKDKGRAEYTDKFRGRFLVGAWRHESRREGRVNSVEVSTDSSEEFSSTKVQKGIEGKRELVMGGSKLGESPERQEQRVEKDVHR